MFSDDEKCQPAYQQIGTGGRKGRKTVLYFAKEVIPLDAASALGAQRWQLLLAYATPAGATKMTAESLYPPDTPVQAGKGKRCAAHRQNYGISIISTTIFTRDKNKRQIYDTLWP